MNDDNDNKREKDRLLAMQSVSAASLRAVAKQCLLRKNYSDTQNLLLLLSLSVVIDATVTTHHPVIYSFIHFRKRVGTDVSKTWVG